ncbi:hypothetical protein BU23DRAFT_563981 [Bimuria novae-zelandiae CBS 107.79]|uniref:Uncharacterized protein n=1 Tax=Bimuria novae-zelandiae CBS 107.79 TaxID=1447943 RepID=A0A6A5VP86_9PLEO|nr:hypothetical protein BU23DRAFT_563981 [Bimuria novae-zelandiae CBS 107.79]
MGSLRSIKSFRTLRSSHSGSKKSDEEPTEPESPHTPVRETPSVSLNFEASPMNEPMFGPMTRTTSGSSSLRVHRSSPITVPTASRNATPMANGTPPGLGAFPVNTVPDSPAPLQRAYVQEAIINNAAKTSTYSDPSDLGIEVDPLPTPMPGTNLPLEDATAPGIMVTSPSAPSMRRGSAQGYFDSIVVADESGFERTKTLDTESGFPTFGNTNSEAIGNITAEHSIPACASEVPELAQASLDEPFSFPPTSDTPAIGPKTPSGSNDYGDGLAYVVFDSPEPTNRVEKVCSESDETPDGVSHHQESSQEWTDAHTHDRSFEWIDNMEGAVTDVTDLSTSTNPEQEAGAEAKLLAAIKELDDATLPAQSPPVDNEKALLELIRAYAHLRQDTSSEDDVCDISIDEPDIAREIKEDVETSIRVMNRSLGG